MKSVTLIGDSIRMGYQPTVTAELSDRAVVWGPEQNGGTSRNVLANLDAWVLSRKSDVVHLNAGLHDLARDKENNGQPRIPLDEYKDNLTKIITRVREKIGAKLIWARITPVNEVNHHQRKSFDRLEADVDAYNAVADGVMNHLGVPVNDLYGFVMEQGRDRLLGEDGVHFIDEGRTLLGRRVAQVIAAAL